MRMQWAKANNEPHFYMMELAPGLIIDARNKGNVARLINSSCAPNCESQKWHDAATGAPRLFHHVLCVYNGLACAPLPQLPGMRGLYLQMW